MATFVDPHGAPEFFCNDFAFLQMAAPGVIRFALQAEAEEGSMILRVKILMPVSSVPRCIAQTTTFLACHAVREVGVVRAMLM